MSKAKQKQKAGPAFQLIFTFICYYGKTVIKYTAA